MSKIQQNFDGSKIRRISDGATEAQINANRQNSKKSTGPQSAEGKKAVAKNAVKHGLFANETVIIGESAEEFKFFRDEMIAEVAPVGPVESMLAERYVSLSWRLKRIERMQNQAIDVMIERDEQPSPLAKLAQSMLPKNLRQSQADASDSDDELRLGRAVITDYSNSRVLDRLMMYERRIENSMLRTLHELERLRLLRELKKTDEAGEQFEPESAIHPLGMAATQEAEKLANPPLGKAATQTDDGGQMAEDGKLIRSDFANNLPPRGANSTKPKEFEKTKPIRLRQHGYAGQVPNWLRDKLFCDK